MHLAPGTRLGRYEVRSLVGAGGMGEVYLADDTTLRRSVAIKVLPTDAAQDRDRLRRFEQEAHAASSLNHPNILTIHEVGDHDGTPFVATEFVEGESLRARIARGRLDIREVLEIGAQVASALAAAHAAGIVHRDIKPENIMVRKDGIVKVLDFGLAKLVARGTTKEAAAATKTTVDTRPGVILGTIQYMSPEQARGLDTDLRTDIWSLAVVLYELLAGRSTFEGRTSSDVIAAILRTEPRPLTADMPDAPPELERIVTKALQKDREERYQDVKDLALDLKSLKRRLDVDTELARHSGGHSEHVSRARGMRRRAAILAMAAVAAVALVYAAYWGYSNRSATGNIDSVAVLPFTNESGDPENEYLSDGISETLINSLSQLSGVKVIARSSSFQYKGKTADLQEVARALGVKSVVTGRVSQRGDNLLIGVELVDTTDRTQVWGEHYNRKASDLIQVQADISAEIAEKLRRRLTTGERDRVSKPDTVNEQAFIELMKSRDSFRRGGTQNMKTAIEHAYKAIAMDPNYALAYLQVAIGTRSLVVDGVLDPKDFMPKAEAALRKALELDDSLSAAHFVVGNMKRDSWDWAGAESAYQRAIALNPNSANARRQYSSFLSLIGRHDEAIAEAMRARDLDPAFPVHFTNIAGRLFFARRYDEVIEHLKQPDVPEGQAKYYTLGYTYAAKGMHSNAIAAYQEAIRLGDDTPSTQIFLGAAYAAGGQRERAQAILTQLLTSGNYVSPGELAILYAALGQREQAFASLEKGFAARDLQLQFLAVDPAFDSLRGDPRFADLLHRVGLPVDAKAVRR